MIAKNILAGFFVSILVFALTFTPSAYAGKVELTTYYPAPYGEYTNLNVSGNVGIGIGTSPSFRLDVLDNQAHTYVARIKNSNAGVNAKGLIIDLGVANVSRHQNNRFIDFAGAGVVAGKIQGGFNAVAYTTNAADFAEYFRADPKNMPQPGELVEFDLSGMQSVQRSVGDVSRVLVGVVSSSPAFVGNSPICKVEDNDCDANQAKYNALVALVGQVSVKVNTSRGPIAIADPIAASDTLGEGAKAVSVGHIVGYAQESLASGSGTIKVLIRPQYYYDPHLEPAR
jgi:hypothetical protein